MNISLGAQLSTESHEKTEITPEKYNKRETHNYLGTVHGHPITSLRESNLRAGRISTPEEIEQSGSGQGNSHVYVLAMGW